MVLQHLIVINLVRLMTNLSNMIGSSTYWKKYISQLEIFRFMDGCLESIWPILGSTVPVRVPTLISRGVGIKCVFFLDQEDYSFHVNDKF